MQVYNYKTNNKYFFIYYPPAPNIWKQIELQTFVVIFLNLYETQSVCCYNIVQINPQGTKLYINNPLKLKEKCFVSNMKKKQWKTNDQKKRK